MNRYRLAATLCAILCVAAATPAVLAADITTPYPGTLTVRVDMTQSARKIYRVHETVPVQPGPLTLYYPKWLPGYHSPSGPIVEVAGFVLTANGKRVPWQRDLVDMYAIHLDVPPGVTTLDVDFEFLSAVQDLGLDDGDESQSPGIADLQWNQVIFYPAGYASKAIRVKPSVALPADWHFATALVPHTGAGEGAATSIAFAPVTLNNLVDSPVVSGRHFKSIDLTQGSQTPVQLDIVADTAAGLAITPRQVDDFKQLVVQENLMFGAHHYDSYHMLVTLSDNISGLGLEHHQSYDIRVPADSLDDASAFAAGASEFAHEYTHSWNGKFRRPYDLWTPDFNSVPMQDDLLWVYEGLTQYWATVMAARSGFWTPAQFRESLAMTAASLDHTPGRTWESLQDTADMAPLLYYAPSAWSNWRRGTDFYPEGVLLWLDVDTKIRALSHDHRSLNDFARLFYGMDDGSYVTKTYTFADVVAALNRVQPYDWATFLRGILDSHAEHAPLAGIARGGYALTYSSKPSAMWTDAKSRAPGVDAMYSAGFRTSEHGDVADVLWNGPAFKAGLIPGMHIVAVNGAAYSSKALDAAIGATQSAAAPITLLVKDAGRFTTLHIDYRGGLRYPHLKRTAGTPDYVDQIIAPLKE